MECLHLKRVKAFLTTKDVSDLLYVQLRFQFLTPKLSHTGNMCFPLWVMYWVLSLALQPSEKGIAVWWKVVKGEFNPWSILRYLKNDATSSFSYLLWLVTDLKIWKRSQGNGWHLQHIVTNPFEEDRNSLNFFHTNAIRISAKTLLKVIIHFLVKAHPGWNMWPPIFTVKRCLKWEKTVFKSQSLQLLIADRSDHWNNANAHTCLYVYMMLCR